MDNCELICFRLRVLINEPIYMRSNVQIDIYLNINTLYAFTLAFRTQYTPLDTTTNFERTVLMNS